MPSSPSPPLSPFSSFTARNTENLVAHTLSLLPLPPICARVAALSPAQEAMLAAVGALLTDHLFRSPGQGVASQVTKDARLFGPYPLLSPFLSSSKPLSVLRPGGRLPGALPI